MSRAGGFLKHDDLPYRPCVGTMVLKGSSIDVLRVVAEAVL